MVEAVVWRCSIRLSAPGRTILGSSVPWLCISGGSSAQGDPSPSSSSSAPTPGCLPENPGIAPDQAVAERTQALASQTRRFLAKVSGSPALPCGTQVAWREWGLCLLSGGAL